MVRALAPELPRHHTPHATLRCHLESVDQARAAALAVAAVTPPFTLRVGGAVLRCGVHYTADAPASDTCRAVHAEVSGAGFEPACRAAAAALGVPFAPHEAHISLAYRYGDEYTDDEVRALDTAAAAAGGPACEFVVDRIAVATTTGLWPTWTVLEDVPLCAAAPAEEMLAQ